MNEFTEAIRTYAEESLEASTRQSYILASATDSACRAAHEAVKQLAELIDLLEGNRGVDPALGALRRLAGHAGYSNSIMTAVSELNVAAGEVSGILKSL